MRLILVATLAFGCGEVVKLDSTSTCGDGEVGAGEECDTSGESAGCNADCTRSLCGDGQVNAAAGEDCDDADADDTNACSNSCTTYSASAPGVMPFTSTGADGAFAPVGNTTLAAGIHNYTTINIPAGVTVTMLGNGSLDLRATAAVVIDGKIDVSGGTGGNGGAGGCAVGNGGGTGGSTGTRVDGALGTTGCVSSAAGGGTGTAGGPGVYGASCTAPGGSFGGGAGGGLCVGGGGGGGYAGGGGGGGSEEVRGGLGAGTFGQPGALGGMGGNTLPYATLTAGSGGVGTGGYAGENGTFDAATCQDYPGTTAGGGAIGRFAEADLAVAMSFYPGSGGGGGGGMCSCIQPTGGGGSGGGGGGGGALRVASPVSITIGATGQLLANGGNGGLVTTTTAMGGGGGSGGVIYVASPSISVATGAIVSAAGGAGGPANPATCGKSGNGGLGRIRLSVGATCSLSGTFTPTLASGCTPASMAEKVYVALYPN